MFQQFLLSYIKDDMNKPKIHSKFRMVRTEIANRWETVVI